MDFSPGTLLNVLTPNANFFVEGGVKGIFAQVEQEH
jgi:hypothetical protein